MILRKATKMSEVPYSLITPKQFKERLACSLGTPVGINTIYSLVKRKGFPSVKIGRQYYVVEDKVNEWLEKETVKFKGH